MGLFFPILYAVILALSVGYLILKKLPFSLFTIFYLLFFLFYGPAFFIFNNNPLFQVKTREFVSSSILLTLFVVGYFTGYAIFKKLKPSLTNYNSWRTKADDDQYINANALFIFSAISIIILFLSVFVYGGIAALKEALTNPVTPEDLDYLRANRTIFGWVSTPTDYISQGLGKLLSLLMIAYGMVKRNKIFLYTGIFFAVLIALVLAGGLTKSGLIFYIIQIVVLIVLIKNIKVNVGRIFLISIIFLVALIGIYLFATTAENAGMAIDFIGYRIFGEPNRVLNLYANTWPDKMPHTWGLNIRVLHLFFGSGTYIPANVYLCDGLQGCTFNCMFIGDAWVDFSYGGVFIQSVLVGILLCYFDYKVFSVKGFVNKALLASFISGLFAMTSVGIITCFITYGLLLNPFFLNILKIKFTPKRPSLAT